jgi:hypothetical protein
MSIRRFTRKQCLRWLLCGSLVGCASADRAANGQLLRLSDDWDYVAPLSSEQFDAPVPMNLVSATDDELIERLQQTEARLAMLERQLNASSQNNVPPAGTQGSLPPVDFGQGAAQAEAEPQEPEEKAEPPAEPKWYEKYGIRGYAQFRWNDVLHRDEDSAPAQHVGDRSVGDDQNFLIRRARLIFFGDISEHLYFYLQPDFAVTPPGSPDATYFAQIRDWYGDIYCDTDKVHRFRVGQSKVPYGWENLQSSQNRLPLDRADPLNSAVRNERDLGVFYYWTPQSVQQLFKFVMDEGLKGSGNYGMWGIGAYNGQGGSFLEQNENLHVVTRFTYPYCFPNGQIVEASVQAYTGMYTVLSTPISPLGVGAPVRPLGTLETDNRSGIRDERVAGTFVYYPQPLGFQTEWTVGRGPALNEAQTEVEEQSLYGGYAMLFYRHKTDCYGEWWPFIRWAYYQGGYKSERNAPYSRIDELELGLEWQLNKQVELVTMFTTTDRTNTVAMNEADALSYQQFRGQLLRIQLQINY